MLFQRLMIKRFLGGVLKDLQKAEKDLSDEIHFCQEHKMDMEVAALRYKYKAFEQRDDDRGWIWNISTKDKITHWMRIPDFIEE